MPYRIEIDLLACVGFAECTKTAPGVFRLDEFANQSSVVDPNGADDETVFRAAEACPVSAISLYDASSGQRVFGAGD
jgi:ferredoxin